MNLTDVVPEKLAPVMVTLSPAQPVPGSSREMLGADEPETTKSLELVAVPTPFVTVMRPVVAPVGTTAVIWVGEFVTNVAETPLKRTPVVPRTLVPEMTTVVPAAPLVGVKLAIDGHPVGTTKLDGLVAVPLGVLTVTGPVAAAVGTTVEMREVDSIVKVALTPLKRTEVAFERLVPVIVTLVPGQPVDGLSELTVGAADAVTVKLEELVTGPFDVTTVIGPVVAFCGTTAVT